MLFLKQSTASQTILIGPFVDDTDGVTAETELTIANTDIRLSANGGDLVAKTSGGATHDEAGWYATTLDATDTATVGTLQLHCKVAGALMVHHEFQVLEEAVYDALFAAAALGYIANAPVNVAQISGDGTAADNAEAFFDGTGYAGTNNVIPTVTTLTGHTPQTGDSFARLGAPAGASISADIAAVKADTAAIINSLTMVAGTIGATGNTTTTLHLTGLTYGDDEVNNHLIAVYDNSAGEWHVRWIIDWVLSTALATLNEALPFTPENSVDTYRMLHIRGDSPSALDLSIIVDAILNALGGDYTIPGSIGLMITQMSSGIIYGTAATGTLSTTQATTNLTGYTDGQLAGRILTWLTGVCEGEQSEITNSANTGGLLTFTEQTLAPENGDIFKIT